MDSYVCVKGFASSLSSAPPLPLLFSPSLLQSNLSSTVRHALSVRMRQVAAAVLLLCHRILLCAHVLSLYVIILIYIVALSCPQGVGP